MTKKYPPCPVCGGDNTTIPVIRDVVFRCNLCGAGFDYAGEFVDLNDCDPAGDEIYSEADDDYDCDSQGHIWTDGNGGKWRECVACGAHDNDL